MPYEPLRDNSPDPVRVDLGLSVLRRRYGLAEPADIVLVAEWWPDLVGDALAERSEVIDIRDSVLLVTTPDPAVADRLRWEAETVCAGFAERSGRQALSGLEVTVRQRRDTR